MSKIIALTRGKETIVDDEDFEWLSQWKWNCASMGYARRMANDDTVVYMHRQILNTPSGMETDHINGNKLDNRRTNLRICTDLQNKWNIGKYSNNKSGFRGVSWSKTMNKWMAQICVNYKRSTLGFFEEKQDAISAYIEASRKYHQEYGQYQ